MHKTEKKYRFSFNFIYARENEENEKIFSSDLRRYEFSMSRKAKYKISQVTIIICDFHSASPARSQHWPELPPLT